jgi:hypothetical protein
MHSGVCAAPGTEQQIWPVVQHCEPQHVSADPQLWPPQGGEPQTPLLQ